MSTQTEHETKGFERMRARAQQAEARRARQWSRLDSQAVKLTERLHAAKAAGDDRQADLVRRALSQVTDVMKKHLADAGGDHGAKR